MTNEFQSHQISPNAYTNKPPSLLFDAFNAVKYIIELIAIIPQYTYYSFANERDKAGSLIFDVEFKRDKYMVERGDNIFNQSLSKLQNKNAVRYYTKHVNANNNTYSLSRYLPNNRNKRNKSRKRSKK
jgi:hypothetical protein